MGRSVITEKFKPKDEIQWMKKSCFLLEVWRLVPKRNVTGATLFRERCIPRDLRRSCRLAVTAQRNLSVLLVSIFATIILQASQKSPALTQKHGGTRLPAFRFCSGVWAWQTNDAPLPDSEMETKLNSHCWHCEGSALVSQPIFGMIGWSPGHILRAHQPWALPGSGDAWHGGTICPRQPRVAWRSLDQHLRRQGQRNISKKPTRCK